MGARRDPRTWRRIPPRVAHSNQIPDEMAIPWTPIGDGGTATIAGGATYTKLLMLGNGTVNLPASGAAVDGQVVLISCTGTDTSKRVTINQGAGNDISDPNDQGALMGIGNSPIIRTLGATFVVTYYASNSTWYEQQ